MAHYCKYESLSLEKISQINQTNLGSFHFMLQILHHHSKADIVPEPFFINISSIASKCPSPYSSVYGATKAYLSNAMAALCQ